MFSKNRGLVLVEQTVGQTKQFLRNRLKDHKNNIRGSLNQQNALTKHIIEKDNFFDFDETKNLTNEENYKKRLFLQMCHIVGTDDAVNLRICVKERKKIIICDSRTAKLTAICHSNQ